MLFLRRAWIIVFHAVWLLGLAALAVSLHRSEWDKAAYFAVFFCFMMHQSTTYTTLRWR